MTASDLLERAQALSQSGEPYAMVTVVRVTAPTSAYVGAQAIVLGDGTLEGWIGGGCATGVVVAAAQEAIAAGEPKLVRISNDQVQPQAGVEQHAMSCASNGTIELFIHPQSARRVLCVLGATPAAGEARFLAGRLGLRLAETPEQVRVVLVATQGQGDEDALEQALSGSAEHVLLIASRRKAERLREVMRMRGIGAARLGRLRSPAGPDAGAKTPAEIALVAMVGVLAALRGRLEAPATIGAGGSADRRPAEPMRPVAAPAPSPPAVAAPTAPAVATPSPPEVAAASATAAAQAHASAVAATAPATFVNPVCGIEVSVAHPKHVVEFEGVSYYFCCDCCWTSFNANPAKYAAIHHAQLGRVSA